MTQYDTRFPYVFLLSTPLSILNGSDSLSPCLLRFPAGLPAPRYVEVTWPKPTQRPSCNDGHPRHSHYPLVK